MKNLVLLLMVTFLALYSCKKEIVEQNPKDEPPIEETVAEATIGPAGGKLETEDVVLIVPEGAFDTTITLRLFIADDPSPDPKRVTGTYRLEGLNAVFSKPLELKIRYEGTLEEESYIALGYNYYVPETEDSVMVNELVSAVDSMGFLKGKLLPLEMPGSSEKSTTLSPYYHPIVLQHYLMIRGWSKISTVRSVCAEIRYDHGFNFDRSKVEKFARYLDEAVYSFDAMGLMGSHVFLGIYKLRVNILDDSPGNDMPSFIEPKLKLESFLQTTGNYKLLTWSYLLNIPGNYFAEADDNQLQMVAGEGVFRFENYCYFRERQNWLQWALICWVREYYYGSNHRVLYAGGLYRFMQPFYGMNADWMESLENIFPRQNWYARTVYHGDGMSSLIKYLLKNFNGDKVLLGKMKSEMGWVWKMHHPIDVILNSVDAPEFIWWPGFFKAYLEGDIWEIPGEKFLEQIDPKDEIHFIDKTDTVKYFDRSYPDLSARLCQVNLSQNLSEYVLGEGDKLSFKLGPESLNLQYVDLLVYRYNEGALTFLGEGSEVIIDNLKGLIDDGYGTLLAVVVNSANESPYEKELDIELTMEIIPERTWPWKFVTIDAISDAIITSNSGAETVWSNFRFNLTDHELDASEDGTFFSTSWLNQNSDYKYEGGIEINVDPETFEITGFYLWSFSESLSDSKVTLSERTEIRGKEGVSIPVVYWDDDYLTHQLSDEEVCSAIKTWTYKYIAYPGESYEYSNTLTSYSCNVNASLLFFWAREK